MSSLALAIGGLSLPALLLGLGATIGLAAVLFAPLGLLGVLLVSVPFASLAELDLGDFSLSATEPLVAALLVSWLLVAAARRDLRLEGGLLLVPLAWVLGAMVLGLPNAPKLSLATKETVKWLELIAVFLFVALHVRSQVVTQRILAVLLFAGVAESLYALYAVAAGQGPAHFAVGDTMRASGTFGQPNPFGGYLATLLPLAVVLVLTLRSRRQQALAGLATGIVGVAFLASQSRGASLGLGVAALIVLVFWSSRSRQLLLPLALGGLALLALALLGLVPSAAMERLGVVTEYFGVFDARRVTPTPENWAVVERMAHWQAGWAMFLDHPILGVGAGNYPAVYDRYFLPGWVDPLGHAHNIYLNTAAELGIAGLTGLLALLLLALRQAVGALRACQTTFFWRALAMGLLASLVVFGLHNVFDNLLVHGMAVQLGLILGLIFVAHRRANGKELAAGE